MVGISASSARRVAATAAHRYKIYRIPKKKGGLRLVAQPAREVKALQRAIVTLLEPLLPIHAAATAYRAGSSILENAMEHVGAKYLLKFDFEDFFFSVDGAALIDHMRKYANSKLSDSEMKFICSLALWKRPQAISRGLCVGAPSSPFLSNTVMYDIDDAIERLCREARVIYSRYSDDITVSAVDAGVLSKVELGIRRIVKDAVYPTLHFNETKRVCVARNTAMVVTGLTLANQGVVTVGRDRKRGVRSGVKKFLDGALGEDDVRRLRGELAFVLGIEPNFRTVLLRAYGSGCESILPKPRQIEDAE